MNHELDKFLKEHNLNNVELDFGGDLRMSKANFQESYLKVLKKANPKHSTSVLNGVIKTKWELFKQERKKHQNHVDATANNSDNRRTGAAVTRSGRKRRMSELPGGFSDNEPIGRRNKKKASFLESESEESEHNDVCEYCEKPGELLLCDSCSAAYHLSCISMKKNDVPDGEWNCPLCEKESRVHPEGSKKSHRNASKDTRAEDYHCYHCGQGVPVVTCESCSKSYHLNCAVPPLDTKPDGWRCQYCTTNPFEHQIEKILFFKFVQVKPEAPQEYHSKATYQIRKFLVKLADYSYWEVKWIDEIQLRITAFSLFQAYSRKCDIHTPLVLEDGETYPDTSDPKIDLENMTPDDIYLSYCIYGIKPEWLQIHHIIAMQRFEQDMYYLVKWRELPHITSSWESENSKHIIDLCELKKHIKLFKKFVNEAIERPNKFKPTRFKPKNYTPYSETPKFLLNNNDLRLHNYQLEGLNWIRYSCANHTNVILADEMGLGKTIQSISFLYSLYKDGVSCGPFLVCAPLSTLPNWEREFETWAPDLYVVSLSMTRENREFIKEEEFYLNKCSPKVPKASRKNVKFHVLLVSYEVAQIESHALKSFRWSVLVLDEAHRIKNRTSKLHQLLAEYNFQFKLLLTGTPLQNNLEELFYLLNFLSPTDFDDAEVFLQEFKDLNKEAQIEKIHKLLGKRLLRRLKSDVLKDIPVKSEVIVPVHLSSLQRKYYKAILNKNYSTLAQKGSTSSSLLNVVMELKKCCNHPYLFHLSEAEQPMDSNGNHELNALIKASSKFVLLEKMLVGLKQGGHRVLIFSQMTKLLDLIEEFLVLKDWKFERIDGSVSTLYRQASIDRFNSKDSQSFVFLLSTRAGGLGINLATADTVIIYDSDWNPHNDIQALSRAHRLGQSKKVMIYRLVTRNSVEERILEVAKKKMVLTHLVVHSGLGKNENMTKRELDDILRFGTAQLFETSADNAGMLDYDEGAILKLLDRTQQTEEVAESGINEYFSSFKVVDYAVKQPVKSEPAIDKTEPDPQKYWQSLLQVAHDIDQEVIFGEFGKGKRQRKQVKYFYQEKDILEEASVDPDFEIEKENTSSSEEGEMEDCEDEEVMTYESTQNQPPPMPKLQPKKEAWKLPPVLSYFSNLNVEVELKRKKMIINKLITFGIPRQDLLFTFKKWGMDKEDKFTVDDFKLCLKSIHASLDRTSLKYPQYVDKFPLDDSGCQTVSSRVALIELIKAKVLYYGCHMPYILPFLYDEHLIEKHEISTDYVSILKPYLSSAPESEENLSFLIKPPQNNKELVSTSSTFKFNIEECGYTELHIFWEAEESKKDDNIWWRYHDYWFLLAICVHGYNEFDAIFADPRFKLLNMPFVTKDINYKSGFIRRRLNLLEQALMIEDVVRKTKQFDVSLKQDSNIVKMQNKILELNAILEAGYKMMDAYNHGKNACQLPLVDLLSYCSSLAADVKNDTSQLSRYIMSSSLRANKLFPLKENNCLLKIARNFTGITKTPLQPSQQHALKKS